MIEYKGFTREERLRFDMLVEAKAVEKILPIHKAQLLSYMEPAKILACARLARLPAAAR
jgi:hypothetical protein